MFLKQQVQSEDMHTIQEGILYNGGHGVILLSCWEREGHFTIEEQ